MARRGRAPRREISPDGKYHSRSLQGFINKMMIAQLGETGGVAHNAKYLTIFFIKLSLVLVVLTLYLYTVVFKTEATGDEDADERQEQYEEPVPFQKLGLVLGLFIILCAAALKYLHF